MLNFIFSVYKKYKYGLKYSFLNYAQAFINVFIALYFAKNMGVEDYGMYRSGIVLFGIVTSLGIYGADKGLIKDLIQRDDAEKIFFNYVLVRVVCSLVIVALLVWWAYMEYSLKSDLMFLVIFLASGFVYSINPSEWLNYKNRLDLYGFIALAERVLFLVFSLFVICFKVNNLLYFIGIAFLITRLIQSLVEWGYVYKRYFGSYFFDLIDYMTIKSILWRHQWLWYSAIATSFMTGVNQLVLSVQAGKREMALLGFSMQIVFVVQLMQSQVARLLSPKIASLVKNNNDKQVVYKKYLESCYYVSVISFVMGVLIYLLSLVLIDSFYVNYSDSKRIILLLMMWTFLLGIGVITNRYLISFDYQREVFYVSAVFGVGCLVLTFYMSNIYGAYGAAMSLLISHGLSIFLQVLLFLSKMRTHYVS